MCCPDSLAFTTASFIQAVPLDETALCLHVRTHTHTHKLRFSYVDTNHANASLKVSVLRSDARFSQ